MEPLQGWESFPGSPAPQPDILRLALYFLLLVPCHFTLSLPLCKEEEYPVGTECCPKCSPGYRVKQACDEATGTVCVPCLPGTYTAHLNGLTECLRCRICNPAMGLETRQKCSTIKDTECGCPRDHLCVREDTDPCAMCQPLETKGSEKKDTGCNNCPPGTFSPLETLEECQPSTNCSGWLETETRPGTCTTEGACFSWLSLILGLSIPCVIIFGLVIWYLKKQKRPSGGLAKRMSFFQRWIRRDAERDTTVSEALQVGLDVTTVAVEETVREDTASCLTPQDLDMEIGLESRG
ncbi:tumor necrosis factor receptor superfamily member 14 isoform 1-T1 [Trichechus inunguis]|uniref:Tumor necrosis factor receptor superfamily member 14 isoform X1 n=1 Tax=Trichechus manatus latirostris TaxID=127582 RepID=A0A2Y9RJ74_TRIMA|nr:tumor necrosis factor receptor superfamily member 14 isoform X1 [Trichechus manatus latirostris]